MAAAGLVFACGPQEENTRAPTSRSSTIVEPETIGIDAVAQEEPAVARTRWDPSNDRAKDITGKLHVSLETVRGGPVIFAFANGITMRAQPIAVTSAENRSGVGAQSFAAILGGDPRVDVHIYRVEKETVIATSRRGSLCGEDDSKHMAVSEFVDQSGNWVMKITAFRSDTQPGGAGEDPGLCGAYAFKTPG